MTASVSKDQEQNILLRTVGGSVNDTTFRNSALPSNVKNVHATLVG